MTQPKPLKKKSTNKNYYSEHNYILQLYLPYSTVDENGYSKKIVVLKTFGYTGKIEHNASNGSGWHRNAWQIFDVVVRYVIVGNGRICL